MRFTKQRQVILNELQQLNTHPTADDMYLLLRQQMPKISLGTIYRNLEILSEQGTIQKLEIGGTQKRFDGNAANHYHVRCLGCGRVDDVEMAVLSEVERDAGQVSKYRILRHRLEFSGICPECQQPGAGPEGQSKKG